MDRTLKYRWSMHVSIVVLAGAMGGIVNSIVAWALGASGVTAGLGIAIAPQLTPGWLYPRLVWGGLWGLLFLVPILRRRPWLKGLLMSLAPSAVQLLIVFPLAAGKGWLGLELGALVPLLVLVVNGVWGLTASWWVSKATVEVQPDA